MRTSTFHNFPLDKCFYQVEKMFISGRFSRLKWRIFVLLYVLLKFQFQAIILTDSSSSKTFAVADSPKSKFY